MLMNGELAEFRVSVGVQSFAGGVDLRIVWPGNRSFVSSLEVVQESDLGVVIPPSMRLVPEEAQRLMDALFEAGIRPTGGLGSVGQLGAVQAHLADMRALVSGALGVALPK